MKIKVPCICTKTTGRARKALCNGRMFPNNNHLPPKERPNVSLPCPYCNGTLKQTKEVPNPSHKMSRWRTEIRCPGSTPRFYGVRHCTRCGSEELEHPAGHFFYGSLLKRCPVKPIEE